MPFPLEQFFAALHLSVGTILDLEPCRVRRVRREAVLSHNALKVHFAHTLKQRRTVLLHVVRISQS
jgi:hypothetical protein